MKKIALAAVSAFVMSTSANAAVNLVVNGDFEAPLVSGDTGDYETIPGVPFPTLTGWSIDSGNIDLVRGPSYPVFDGNQALDLVGTGVSTGSISQMLATAIGTSYVLTFAYINNTDNPGPLSANVFIDGNLFTSVSDSGGLPYNVFTGTFTATSTSTLLSFADSSGVSNQGLFLDGISVAAVPEPATWAMMIGGFGLVGGAMRRRRKIAVSFA